MSELLSLFIGLLFGFLIGVIITGSIGLKYDDMKDKIEKSEVMCDMVKSKVESISIANDVVCKDGSEFTFK